MDRTHARTEANDPSEARFHFAAGGATHWRDRLLRNVWRSFGKVRWAGSQACCNTILSMASNTKGGWVRRCSERVRYEVKEVANVQTINVDVSAGMLSSRNGMLAHKART